MRRRLTGRHPARLLPRLTADRRSLLVIGAAALAFAFLSLGEFASVHEFIGRRTRVDETVAASVMLYGAWRLVGPVGTGTYR